MARVMTRQEMRRWDRFYKKHKNMGQQAEFMKELIREREKRERCERSTRSTSPTGTVTSAK